jgi:hypothetical protein
MLVTCYRQFGEQNEDNTRKTKTNNQRRNGRHAGTARS